jgi:Type II secretion system (T2SS), protein G
MATLKKAGILPGEFPDKDRWGHAYSYRPSTEGSFDLRSVGPDGAWGTGDDQARVDDWKWKDCRERSGCW